MNTKIKAVIVMAAVAAMGVISGCGGSGGSAPSASTNSAGTPSAAPPAGGTSVGATLYASNCSSCHGALATSSKKGVTLARLQSAIASDTGGMSFLSTLTAAEQQSIVDALNPSTTPVPPPTPNPTPNPAIDGAALYTSSCASCHGALATSAKKGVTLTRLQNAIAGNTGNMGFLSSLSTAQQQAIVDALATTPVPPPTPTPTPSTDGAALYAANCASCHGPLATSAKTGATAARIQTAINNGTGGMGSLSVLTTAQINALATALATTTAPPSTPPACGSCHAIPPATGIHAKHNSKGVACATCHGSGYSSTAVNAVTHNNGVKNLTTTIGWTASTRSCANSCHGTRFW